METLSESKNSTSAMGFLKHVFNFDSDSKSEILNITQYSIIALLPIVILNKLMQKFVPEADEEKGSIELLAEIIIQIFIMFLGIFFIDRIITYIPTYSGLKYCELNITHIILAVLLIVLSLQTKLGEKVSILYDRVSELWEGTDKDDKKKKKKGTVKVTQPINQGNTLNAPVQQQAMNQSLYGGSTPINQLPISTTTSQQDYSQQQQQPQHQQQGYDNMDAGSMIMAANEVLGGSAFGSNF
jgi:hypothetical protein